jgi:hypothetical protein
MCPRRKVDRPQPSHRPLLISSVLEAPTTFVKSLGLPTHLRCPPARPHQQKSPILQKLRRLSFNRVSHKLQQPPKAKQPHSHPQQSVPHNRCHQHRQRQHNNRNPKRMRQPVQRMLMALRILRDPALPTSSGKHGATILSPLHQPQPKSSQQFTRLPLPNLCHPTNNILFASLSGQANG